MLGVRWANFAVSFSKNGQQVGIIGRIQTRTYDDDQGQKHYVTEVIAEEAYFADTKKDNVEPEKQSVISGIPVNTVETNSDDDLPF